MESIKPLPPYFPLKLNKCNQVAESFFSCFESESFPNGDKDVARKAIGKCSTQLLEYEKCMDLFVGPKMDRRV